MGLYFHLWHHSTLKLEVQILVEVYANRVFGVKMEMAFSQVQSFYKIDYYFVTTSLIKVVEVFKEIHL